MVLFNMLTSSVAAAIITTPLKHSGAGICTPSIGQKRPVSKLVFLCPSKIINKGLFPVKSFMVGCIEQPLIWLAGAYTGSANLIQSIAQDFALKDGGLFPYIGHKPMPKSNTQKPLTISVSETKQKTLHIQAEIIGYSIESFCLDSNTNTLTTLKNDALELVRLLDEIDHNNQRKTSLFNVLSKGTKRLIAERVTFNQARQYPDCIMIYLLNVTRNNEPFVSGEYETEEQAITALGALMDQYGDEITYTLDEQA
ncbi:hypothetical protein AU255_02210 [Methyloprofundus sedimenti]|uniref:Uncharacterized protein n=2 Tax=Methyloprofundus sedimenti TaxID=1420851 RepID=A0A1V8M5A8_9GAMM|nr:hypothetical protein AU255_02210 [Methyloprofundus sedimenti]